MGKTKKRPVESKTVYEALRWLSDFANVGIDRTQPRGPIERLLLSRFLGLDYKRRGYLPDVSRPGDINIVLGGGGHPRIDLVIQQRGGVEMRWYRMRGEREHYYPAPDPLLAYRPDFQLDELPRPRDIMREVDGLRWTLPPGDAREEAAAFWQVQGYVRELLSRLWYVAHDAAPGAERFTILQPVHCQLVVMTALDAIGRSCLGRPGAPVPAFLDCLLEATLERSDDEAAIDGAGLLIAHSHFNIVVANRAPVWITGAGGLTFVADAFPGVVWAEILNLLNGLDWDDAGRVLNPALKELVWCSWCGRFLFPARRARDFCSDACARRFSERGPQDRRS
jgi:hypothetical protein